MPKSHWLLASPHSTFNLIGPCNTHSNRLSHKDTYAYRWAIFFQNSLTRENEHFEHIDSATILSLQKGSDPCDWISIFACSPKVNSEPLIYIFHPSIDSIPVNSFKQEGSPTPKANFFRYIQLTLIIMSSVGYGSLLCQVTDPKPVSYLEHCIDMVHTTSVKPISRTFQGFFKDKLQF